MVVRKIFALKHISGKYVMDRTYDTHGSPCDNFLLIVAIDRT